MFLTRLVTHLLIFLFFILHPIGNTCLATTTKEQNLSSGALVGIWKLCYSPHETGGPEIDGGYLVLLPDNTFNRLANGYDFGSSEPQGIETGTYKISNSEIFFSTLKSSERGEPSSENYSHDSSRILHVFSLVYVSKAKIVLFDNIDILVERPVLKWKDKNTFDYSFAKIY